MPDGRLFAIGDMHGCADELERLLGAVTATAKDTVVFLGDYIDRGPDSRAVIDLVLAWRRSSAAQVVCLKGNHEDMALGYLGRGGQWGEAWHRNGGAAALRSYGLPGGASPSEARAGMPDEHVAFLDSLALSHRWSRWMLVHAGVRASRPLHDQHEEDLLWIREEFLTSSIDVGATVVFGHTPHRRVLDHRPCKIGIDTGCVYGGALTCLVLPDEVIMQVRLGDRTVRHGDLAGPVRSS
jgi:serine/threonine protein phosphatase 1